MLPGPSYAVPLVGGVVQMVLDPYKFWEDQRKAAFPGARPQLLPRLPHIFVAAHHHLTLISLPD